MVSTIDERVELIAFDGKHFAKLLPVYSHPTGSLAVNQACVAFIKQKFVFDGAILYFYGMLVYKELMRI